MSKGIKDLLRKSINLSIVTLCALFMFTACENDEVNREGNLSVLPVDENGNPTVVFTNPYEAYGEMAAGEILYYMQNTQYSGNTYAGYINDYYNIRMNYLVNKDPLGLSYEEYYTMNENDRAKSLDSTGDFNIRLDLFTAEIRSLFNQSLSIPAFIDSIKVLEATAMYMSSPDLLKATARLRHGIVFWDEQFKTGSVFETYVENDTTTTYPLPGTPQKLKDLSMQLELMCMGLSREELALVAMAFVLGGQAGAIAEAKR